MEACIVAQSLEALGVSECKKREYDIVMHPCVCGQGVAHLNKPLARRLLFSRLAAYQAHMAVAGHKEAHLP